MGAEEEEVVVTLSGGAPWGFRLQGGSEQKRPLQVSKIRKRSKACRGGLWENDELVSINGKPCANLSHASAMQIIDSSNGILNIVVKRAVSGDSSAARLLRSPSPKQARAVSPASPLSQATQALSPEPPAPPIAPQPEQQSRRRQQLENLTSPPDSEAYYAETDSDADNVAHEKHRRARKKSPRSPPGGPNNKAGEPQDEVSLSEMSGYESTPEAAAQTREGGDGLTGVAKREIVCQPGSRTDTPFSETEALVELPLPEDRETSPEALLLPHATKIIRAERHLIPMVGPVEHPVDEDLTTTYAEKAKQAIMPQEGSKLNLGKKISIPKDVMLEELSLLTNKGSKMFKLRQMRVEKFIYENNPDAFIDNSVDNFQRFIPSVGGHYGVDAHSYSHSGGRMVSGVTVGPYGSSKLQFPPIPPPKPGSKGGAGGTGAGGTGAGGTGAGHPDGTAGTGGGIDGGGSQSTGGKDDNKAGSGKHITIFKTYISPWERALGLTPQEKSQFIIDLLSYGTKGDLCHYKSFNRTAVPYGGYEKAAKLMTFQMPEFDAGPLVPEPVIVYNQEVSNRPSFNRTPVPWLASGEPAEYSIEVNVPLAGETEEL